MVNNKSAILFEILNECPTLLDWTTRCEFPHRETVSKLRDRNIDIISKLLRDNTVRRARGGISLIVVDDTDDARIVQGWVQGGVTLYIVRLVPIISFSKLFVISRSSRPPPPIFTYRCLSFYVYRLETTVKGERFFRKNYDDVTRTNYLRRSRVDVFFVFVFFFQSKACARTCVTTTTNSGDSALRF